MSLLQDPAQAEHGAGVPPAIPKYCKRLDRTEPCRRADGRRCRWGAAGVLLASACLAVAEASDIQKPEHDAGLRRVTLMMAQRDSYRYVGYHIAREQGFYRDAGLDVRFLETPDGRSGILEVLDGQADFGICDERLIARYLQGSPVVVLAAWIQRAPHYGELQTALMPDGQDRTDMRRDIDDMEHMLDEYLDFARGQWVEEPDPVDVGELLAAAAAPMTDKVKLEITLGLIANVRGGAMKRAFTNLLQNAAAHAAHIEAQAYKDQDVIVVVVDDDGPGIPAEERAEALRAFTRLDAARNQNVKGVGLGLAIVRDVARGHGGDLTLDTSPMGGLRAVIRIPASAED